MGFERDCDTKGNYVSEFKVNDRILTVPDYKDEPYLIMRILDVDEYSITCYLSLFKDNIVLKEGQEHKWHLDGLWVTMKVEELFFNRAKLSFSDPSGRIIFRRLGHRANKE